MRAFDIGDDGRARGPPQARCLGADYTVKGEHILATNRIGNIVPRIFKPVFQSPPKSTARRAGVNGSQRKYAAEGGNRKIRIKALRSSLLTLR